jgi:hypothetical protein
MAEELMKDDGDYEYPAAKVRQLVLKTINYVLLVPNRVTFD